MKKLLIQGSEENIREFEKFINAMCSKEITVLKSYCLDNLVGIADVQKNYECTDLEAMRVLEALSNQEYVNGEILEAICEIAESFNLKEKP